LAAADPARGRTSTRAVRVGVCRLGGRRLRPLCRTKEPPKARTSRESCPGSSPSGPLIFVPPSLTRTPSPWPELSKLFLHNTAPRIHATSWLATVAPPAHVAFPPGHLPSRHSARRMPLRQLRAVSILPTANLHELLRPTKAQQHRHFMLASVYFGQLTRAGWTLRDLRQAADQAAATVCEARVREVSRMMEMGMGMGPSTAEQKGSSPEKIGRGRGRGSRYVEFARSGRNGVAVSGSGWVGVPPPAWPPPSACVAT